jgi:hypothetical protein
MLVTTATELSRLMACIGSRNMAAALPPDHDHEARDEGNAADWLAGQIFSGIPTVPGHRAPNGYVITEEMFEHVHTYLGALDAGDMQVETTHGGDLYEVRGRADHIKFRDTALTVDDLKYGFRIVSPIENWTLISHAIGWCIRNQTMPATIILRIHQPRPYHPDGPLREWRISYEQLLRYHARIQSHLSHPTDELHTGPQCAKCHALATCPAARVASMNAIDASALAFNDTLDNPILAHELDTLRWAMTTIENRAAALEELMTYRIQSGQVIEGYALKTRYAQSKWNAGLTADVLSGITGIDLSKDALVTPAEAKRRGVPEHFVTALTSRPVIGTRLERINADAEARKVFGNG